MTQPGIMTSEQLAKRWGMHKVSLNRIRNNGGGPKYFKIGRQIRYKIEDVEEYERKNCKVPQ